MLSLSKKIAEATTFIQTKIQEVPGIGIILGTGLGGLVKEIQIKQEIDYHEIPHFVTSTVESHSGKLIFGMLGGKFIVAMQGRFHLYEGYSIEQITFPVRVMKAIGIQTLLVSNAAGNLHPQWRKGDVMLITDHINLLGQNPLIGANEQELGPRFPDMSEPYDHHLIHLAEKVSLELGIKVQKGVYASMTGPTLETRAEYRMLRIIGADAIGMSTVPEVIVANHQGTKVFGVSILTDDCFPESLQPVNISEIIEIAGKSEPKMTAVMKGLIEKL